VIHPNGSESVLTAFPWAQLHAVRHCPCSDGKTRYCAVAAQPDTHFSVPARVQVTIKGRRRSVRGYLTTVSGAGRPEGYEFRPYEYGPSAGILPPWPPATWEEVSNG